ncbi:MAG TPA: 4Fe-4S dicluster domain-containing protein [Candidatus Methanofastidiosa archaeon]|nr:4Fe-4S dicluster domain-containing protein [Candidatus Methanofastidiosa archaeon]HPR41786.1 4Fe-4S dicluster domain-containing protein [Candidatus Methanofastidiosa archaeon]
MSKNMKEVIEKGNAFACIQCGRCTGSCPAGRECSMRTRKIVHLAKMGEDVFAIPELWECTTCFTCQERCPKEVKTTDMIIELRNISVERNYFPSMAGVPRIIIKNLYDTGSGQPLSPEVAKMRSIIGLAKDPCDVSRDEKDLKAFQRLLDSLPLMRGVAK